MSNVFDAARGQVVDDEHFVAALQICVGEMRTDEAGAACDQNSQVGKSST